MSGSLALPSPLRECVATIELSPHFGLCDTGNTVLCHLQLQLVIESSHHLLARLDHVFVEYATLALHGHGLHGKSGRLLNFRTQWIGRRPASCLGRRSRL